MTTPAFGPFTCDVTLRAIRAPTFGREEREGVTYLVDDTLTPTGPRLVDHLENGLGEGPYAGHAFSLGVRLVREGTAPMAGQGRGQID